MQNLFSLPIVQRKLWCTIPMIIIGIVMMLALPEEIVRDVPNVQVATVWNYMLIGMALMLAGCFNVHPIFGQVPGFVRGFVVGAIVNFDYMVYTWGDNQTFWSVLLVTAILAGTVDFIATKKSGDGLVLTKAISV